MRTMNELPLGIDTQLQQQQIDLIEGIQIEQENPIHSQNKNENEFKRNLKSVSKLAENL